MGRGGVTAIQEVGETVLSIIKYLYSPEFITAIFVNGQWRVGIFASRKHLTVYTFACINSPSGDIRNEEEILFDYGKHFELFD